MKNWYVPSTEPQRSLEERIRNINRRQDWENKKFLQAQAIEELLHSTFSTMYKVLRIIGNLVIFIAWLAAAKWLPTNLFALITVVTLTIIIINYIAEKDASNVK